MKWKEGKEAALMITVNMHAEFGALSYYPHMQLEGSEQEDAGNCIMYPGTMRILELLDY